MMGSSIEAAKVNRRQNVRDAINNHSTTIENLMKIGNTPGLSIGVLCEDEVVLERGYGYADLTAKAEASSGTSYPIASISKGFTAVACGILVADGKLSWDDPIRNVLPDHRLPNHQFIEQRATLVDILSHRTGLEDETTPFLGPNGIPFFADEATLYLALNASRADPPNFRNTWAYCPDLYGLVTLIIEKVSEMSLAEFMATRIFQPLGMHSTSLIGTRAVDQGAMHAMPYSATADGSFVGRDVPDVAYKFPLDASMGIESNVVDMLKWARAISTAFNHMQPATSREIQNPATIILPEMEFILHPWCALPPNEGGQPAHGLGWFLHHGYYIFDDTFDFDGQTDQLDWPCTLPKIHPEHQPMNILYHSGLGHGFTSSLHVYPESRDAVVVLGNSSYSGDAVHCISRLLTTILCGHELSIPDLEYNLGFYTDIEVGRWREVEKGLRQEQKDRQKVKNTANVREVAGRYLNVERNLELTIVPDSDVKDLDLPGVGQPLGAVIKFGNVTNLGLGLWNFCDDTLCFFPSEQRYQQWAMGDWDHWAQFLLHLDRDESSSVVSGIWWQFDSGRDGILFQQIS